MYRVLVSFFIAGIVAAATGVRAEGPPTPDEERAALRLADPALGITLVAGEPEVVSPVAVAWDEHERLYVVEMSDYPDAPSGGRIKRLEDRDGDGRYEHATVFADGLAYPTGVLPWNGGVLVTAAPDLLFLQDTDGDGRADARRVVLTGFGQGNQQLRVNSPTWGLDNWVYLANGRSGGQVRRPADPPGAAVAIPRSDLRLRPETGEFEPIAGFSQFGLPRDDWGDRFPSWNTVPLRHVVLERRVRSSGSRQPAEAGPTVAEVLDPSDGGWIFSLAPAQRRFNAETVTYFNATCGSTIYRGDLLGEAYRGHAFVCEPLTSVVHHRRLDPSGPTYTARRVEQGCEFLASTHPWFRPVNLATGPDGALYVVDFCRAWVEHPAFVPKPQRGSVDFRQGHDHGRLWRIAPRTPPKRGDERLLAMADPVQLVEALAHRNGWRRDTAQRLLVERQTREAIPPLRTLALSDAGPLPRVHALWTLEGLGALDLATLRAGLHAPQARVREAAARLGAGRAADLAAELSALTDDPDERVRLRVALALAPRDTEPARQAVARIATRDAGSSWTVAAILDALGPQPAQLLASLTRLDPSWLASPTPAQARFLVRLAEEIGSAPDEAEIQGTLDRIAAARSEIAAFALLLGLERGHARTPPRARLTHDHDPAARVLSAARTAALSGDRPVPVRTLAFELLEAARPADAQALVLPLLEPSEPLDVQAAAAQALGRRADGATVAAVIERWDRLALATRRRLLGVLASQASMADPLVAAVRDRKIDPVEIDPATRTALRRLRDPALQARIDAVLSTAPSADRREVVRRYEPALTMKPDLVRGAALFARHCQTCHARSGQGARVGPDLISVAGRPPEDLLAAILDPSREAAPDGQAVLVITTAGRTLTGLLAEETPAAIRLRAAEGLEEVVPRGEIEALRPTGRSLMPDGLEQVLGVQDVADLIDFLRHGPPPP